MRIGISQSNYLPWPGYFKLINQVDKFIFYDEVKYTKNDWRNRNLFENANGEYWLTVPVPSTSQNKRISEVEIIQNAWQVKHLQSLEHSYKKTPYYNLISETMLKHIEKGNHRFLSDLNETLILSLFGIMQIKVSTMRSEITKTKVQEHDRNLRLIELVHEYKGNVYVTTPKARNYLDIKLFEKNKIAVEFMNFEDVPIFRKKWNKSERNLSALDSAFNDLENLARYVTK